MKRGVAAAAAAVVAVVTIVAVANHGGSAPSRPMIRATNFGGPAPSSPVAGDVLLAENGQWSGSPTGFAFAWKDCDASGANCTTAAGSPTNTRRYQIVSGDAGFTIRVAVTASYAGHPDATVLSQPTLLVGGTFPLAVSANGRFLQTASGTPFLMVGDSPWTVVGNSDVSHASAYFSNRASHGFNTALMSVLCDSYISCANSDGTTYDGVAPFTSGSSPANYNLNTPNSTYFARLHDMVAAAQADGIVALLVPLDTGDDGTHCSTGASSGSWLQALIGNGDGNAASTTSNDYKFGQYLGNTFKDLSNIIWLSGNDFNCIGTAADKNDALSLAAGIRNTDPGALQSLESDYNNSTAGSTSLTTTSGASTGWGSAIDLNQAYTYQPAWGLVRTARGQSSTQPTFMGESAYEGQAFGYTPTTKELREQEWWTMTSGVTGQVYGGPSFGFSNSTSLTAINSTGAAELKVQTDLLSTLAWQTLAPDTGHTLLFCTSSGTQCGSSTGNVATDTTVTDSADSFSAGAAHLALAYIPDRSVTVTVDLSKFTGTVTAKWFDPANGATTTIGTFSNSGTHNFTQSSNNNDGASDWALLLQS